MALKPCRECGREVSDQAEVCPNCGIKGPVSEPLVRSVVPQGITDEAILAMGNVMITNTLAKFNNQTFPINSIGSVTLVKPRMLGAILFGII